MASSEAARRERRAAIRRGFECVGRLIGGRDDALRVCDCAGDMLRVVGVNLDGWAEWTLFRAAVVAADEWRNELDLVNVVTCGRALVSKAALAAVGPSGAVGPAGISIMGQAFCLLNSVVEAAVIRTPGAAEVAAS